MSSNRFEIIGLVYFGQGSGLPHQIQLDLEITLLAWHFTLLVSSAFLLWWSNRYRPNRLTRLVYTIILIHCIAKTISDSLFVLLLTVDMNALGASIAFEAFEIMAIVTYYCMFGIVLFSWIEVVFRVEHLGHGEDKVRMLRNVFCVFTSMWISAVFIISETYLNIDQEVAIMVFGVGMLIISGFSFALSIAFIVYWVKLHRMVTALQIHQTTQRKVFLVKVAVVTIIFILCLDAKIAHYFINVRRPFVASIWDLYALNYFPEALAVTVALAFFGSNMKSVDYSEDFGAKNNYTARTDTDHHLNKDEQRRGLIQDDESTTTSYGSYDSYYTVQ
ncbi:hypothetical protein SAMD00019534_084060 [Acytostelium subglobosum LB1]|uniref:hypothetical protein n=1 Tax=Acytostelium subglobosum LB1 TaxID=1410327 RepID=UPI000644A380|nr:hypothetical protein SAMD00019534_084060 [Acytostelium subglobosum LB1]GAM25231.1 hypothetical protein SAMD00019534_084060 [Acytostelium subglobosum LB1]|eukprot:XP_012751751.1 hypothetical protein SAMD00019534_084060 [Acytostelium subglobosum LB1]